MSIWPDCIRISKTRLTGCVRLRLFVKESLPSPLGVQYAIADSLTIEETLARAESAVASALQTEEPDIYEDMAQYILTQLCPGDLPHCCLPALATAWTDRNAVVRCRNRWLIIARDRC